MKYSSEAVAFETWDWGGDFGKTVGVSAAMGAVSGSLAYGIGEVGSALASGGMGEVGVGIITTGLHMGTQGGLSAAMGGDFWSAALAAGVGHLGGMAMSKAGLGKFGQAAGASVLSGTTSVISGGSFFEGAVTGLIVLMCNQWMHEINENKMLETFERRQSVIDKATEGFIRENNLIASDDPNYEVYKGTLKEQLVFKPFIEQKGFSCKQYTTEVVGYKTKEATYVYELNPITGAKHLRNIYKAVKQKSVSAAFVTKRNPVGIFVNTLLPVSPTTLHAPNLLTPMQKMQMRVSSDVYNVFNR